MGQACIKHGKYNGSKAHRAAIVTDLRVHWGRPKIKSQQIVSEQYMPRGKLGLF